MRKGILTLGLAIACLASGGARQEAPLQVADPFQLGLVLKSAREYCRRLERAALDFVCLEEVSELVDLSRENVQSTVTQVPTNRVVTGAGAGGLRELRFNTNPAARRNSVYLFDYQFVRREGKVEEKRALLEKDGKKASGKMPLPARRAFNFSDILLAPVQLLDERFAEYYSYRLLGRETIEDMEAWVLEVAPRLTGVSRYLGAKLWLSAIDASVLRIEWDPSTFGHYESILARAESFQSTPALRSHSEFGIAKNGLRFPSVDFTEEAYRSADGKLFVRARTNIAYKEHKFFTVETETTFKK